MQTGLNRVEAESLDDDDFLVEMTHWSRELAAKLAKRHDIGPLTEDHWKIIEFVRTYYLTHRTGPPVVKIGKATGFSPSRICELFPCGMARGGYRLAGLPRPTGCM
jgi:tRNA 2-thiouridine synthesizing protein E